MDRDMQNKLVAAGRQDLIDIWYINASGYAGILSNGNIVDRRIHAEAIPVPENPMFGVAPVKPWPTEDIDEALCDNCGTPFEFIGGLKTCKNCG